MKRSLAPPLALAGSDPTSLSPTPSRSSSTSSLDTFHAIGASLKRVKISTSPGELRLNKDLEEAASAGRRNCGSSVGDDIVWIPVDPSDPSRGGWADPTGPEPPLFAPAAAPQAAVGRGGSAPRHANPPLELRSSDGMSVLRRDPVDPLRMRLSVSFTAASERGSEASAALCECWTYLLQIPRMYPHSPPIVARVSRSMPQLHQVAGVPTLQPNSVQAPGGNGNNEEPPPLERVVVTVSPPAAFGFCESSRHHQQHKYEDSSKRADLDRQDDDTDSDEALCWSEAKFDGWSPVSSLSDLLVFLVELPRQRREKWRASGRKNRRQRRYREQERKAQSGGQRSRRQDGLRANRNGSSGRFPRHVSMTPYDDLDDNGGYDGSSGMEDDGIIGQPQPQAADEEHRDDNNDDMTVSSTSSQSGSHPQDRPDTEATKHVLLPPNRFDVGYDRNYVSSIGLSGSTDPRIRPDTSQMGQRWSENSIGNGTSGVSLQVRPMASEASASSLPPHPNFAGWNSSTSDERPGFHASGRMVANAGGGIQDAERDAGVGRLRVFGRGSYDDMDQHMMME
mmetsp:Transcript_20127/g.58195  ORF Transcript_20127/g.58195 Transcript_20127/m.58195 type:complete len:565 (-) Transcript_20127:432-2126(-)|eukprot:CAMPEP_0113554954 /NCGR_PEP_ID=MMETSP0015_2-20120614/16442_1 /TAXON_ID=2838 /ORGANISM="Odontella" /LENGTH=564 /DNA_ID=CAMNT_0000456165 /DNA_START=231 /DNA_END=1925 /DNA_ORIENTATION=- /assembly_acc=CAM_ASM_000160